MKWLVLGGWSGVVRYLKVDSDEWVGERVDGYAEQTVKRNLCHHGRKRPCEDCAIERKAKQS